MSNETNFTGEHSYKVYSPYAMGVEFTGTKREVTRRYGMRVWETDYVTHDEWCACFNPENRPENEWQSSNPFDPWRE